MRVIYAKFPSKCAETGRQIYRGDKIYYDPVTKKAYHPCSDFVRVWESKREVDSMRRVS